MAKALKLEVKKDHLLAMVKAFRDYQKLGKEVPELKSLMELANRIETELLLFNKVIHHQYDGMEMEKYMAEVDQEIKLTT